MCRFVYNKIDVLESETVHLTTRNTKRDVCKLNLQFKLFKEYVITSSNLVGLLFEIVIFTSKYGLGIRKYLNSL